MRTNWRVLAVLPALMLGAQVAAQQAAPAATADRTTSSSTAAATAANAANTGQLAQFDMRASKLIGKDVKNAQGENLGTVQDLVLDVEHAHVRYIVLSYGGFLGLGERLAAFPVSRFKPGQEDGLILQVSRAELEKAPGFKESAWPDWNDKSYTMNVDRLFLKDDELARGPEGGRLTRASDVLGKDVSDGGNRNAGSIEDVVVNLANGQLRFVVLDYASRMNTDQRLVALPSSAFRFPSRPDLPIFLLLDRERVAKAEPFDEEKWAERAATSGKAQAGATQSGGDTAPAGDAASGR
ncbi:MAG TPA: PRC-barrel domain-containing protein [Noviherbaspirillum sp.]